LAVACGSNSETPKIVVAASSEYVGASVRIDGQVVGKLDREGLIARIMDRLLPRPDFFPAETASLLIDPSGLAEGKHRLVVTRGNQQLLDEEFEYPLREDSLVFWLPEKKGPPSTGD
jgi:hypothetical protein